MYFNVYMYYKRFLLSFLRNESLILHRKYSSSNPISDIIFISDTICLWFKLRKTRISYRVEFRTLNILQEITLNKSATALW